MVVAGDIHVIYLTRHAGIQAEHELERFSSTIQLLARSLTILKIENDLKNFFEKNRNSTGNWSKNVLPDSFCAAGTGYAKTITLHVFFNRVSASQNSLKKSLHFRPIQRHQLQAA